MFGTIKRRQRAIARVEATAVADKKPPRETRESVNMFADDGDTNSLRLLDLASIATIAEPRSPNVAVESVDDIFADDGETDAPQLFRLSNRLATDTSGDSTRAVAVGLCEDAEADPPLESADMFAVDGETDDAPRLLRLSNRLAADTAEDPIRAVALESADMFAVDGETEASRFRHHHAAVADETPFEVSDI